MALYPVRKKGYAAISKLKHSGRIQHRNRGKGGNNIVIHVISGVDDSAEYKMIKGQIHVRDANIEGKGHTAERKFITLGEHNRKHYPIVQNPLNGINHDELKHIDFFSENQQRLFKGIMDKGDE
jgi:hypothetical protein